MSKSTEQNISAYSKNIDKNIPVLISDRLIMKPLCLSFLSNNYLSWMQDEKVIKYMGSGGKNYTMKMLKNYIDEVEKNKIFSWAIIIKKNKKHIGNIKVDPINYKNLVGEYGIMIGDKKNWGKGFGKEASKKVINYCFKELKLRKINLGVISHHKDAILLYKSLGFIQEGRFKNHVFFQNRFVDYLWMALFNKQ